MFTVVAIQRGQAASYFNDVYVDLDLIQDIQIYTGSSRPHQWKVPALECQEIGDVLDEEELKLMALCLSVVGMCYH